MDNSQLSNAITECYNIVNNFIQRTGDLQARNERDLGREIERLEREYNDAQQRLNRCCGLSCDWHNLCVGGKKLGEYTLGEIAIKSTKFENITLQEKKLGEKQLGGKNLTEYFLKEVSVGGVKFSDVKFGEHSLTEIKLSNGIVLNDIELKDVKLKLGDEEISLGSIKLSDVKLGDKPLGDVEVELGGIITGKVKLSDVIFFGKKFVEIRLIDVIFGENESLQKNLADFRKLKTKIGSFSDDEKEKFVGVCERLLEDFKQIKLSELNTNNTDEVLTKIKELKEESYKGNMIFPGLVGLLGVAGTVACMFLYESFFALFKEKSFSGFVVMVCDYPIYILLLLLSITMVIYSLIEFRILRKAKLEFERKRYEEQLRLLAKRNSQ